MWLVTASAQISLLINKVYNPVSGNPDKSITAALQWGHRATYANKNFYKERFQLKTTTKLNRLHTQCIPFVLALVLENWR